MNKKTNLRKTMKLKSKSYKRPTIGNIGGTNTPGNSRTYSNVKKSIGKSIIKPSRKSVKINESIGKSIFKITENMDEDDENMDEDAETNVNPIFDFINKNENILAKGVVNIDKNIGLNKKVFSPNKFISKTTYGDFMNFLKRYIKQPFIREYLVKKYNPSIPYAMIRIDYKDDTNKDSIMLYNQKINFIRKILKHKKYITHDFILDIALQNKDGNGHYCSLKRDNAKYGRKTIFMDSDPFFYGNESQPEFSALVKNYSNPIEVYGDDNKCTSDYKHKKSIQNLNKSDYFCQSWSLLFLTIAAELDLPNNLNFQEITPIDHSDRISQINSFPLFINNFKLLISFWIQILNDNKDQLNQLIIGTQYENWKSEEIINKLNDIEKYIDNLIRETNNKTDEQKYKIFEKNFEKNIIIENYLE
jgi:hypothetical protein